MLVHRLCVCGACVCVVRACVCVCVCVCGFFVYYICVITPLVFCQDMNYVSSCFVLRLPDEEKRKVKDKKQSNNNNKAYRLSFLSPPHFSSSHQMKTTSTPKF